MPCQGPATQFYSLTLRDVDPDFRHRNITRTPSCSEQLGVRVTGEQKLSPFPHWTLSTATPGKRYSFLSVPVSDWFVGANIGQAMEVGHTSASVHALVDY